MTIRYVAVVAFLCALVAAVAIGSMPARGGRLHSASTHPALVICDVFGQRFCLEALEVAWCESRFSTEARNGQYLGLFQMGSSERRRYGHGHGSWSQARAAKRYFVASGRTWGPWSCKP